MAHTEQHYVTKDGTAIPYRTWHKVGKNFSIMPLKTTYRLRDDVTGEVAIPAGPAARDSLMMALYYKRLPGGYISFAFGEWGRKLMEQEDSESFYDPWKF